MISAVSLAALAIAGTGIGLLLHNSGGNSQNVATGNESQISAAKESAASVSAEKLRRPKRMMTLRRSSRRSRTISPAENRG